MVSLDWCPPWVFPLSLKHLAPCPCPEPLGWHLSLLDVLTSSPQLEFLGGTCVQVEKLTTALGAPRLCTPGASPVAWGWGGGTCTVTSPRAALPMGRVPLGWGDDGGHSPPQQLHCPCCTDQSLSVGFAGVNFGATDLKIIVVTKRFETPSLSATHQGG